MKAPPSQPMLIVNKSQDTDNGTTFINVDKTIVDHAIPVTKTFKNNNGDLVLICDTLDSREKLNNLTGCGRSKG